MATASSDINTRGRHGTNEIERLKKNTQDQLNRLVQQVNIII